MYYILIVEIAYTSSVDYGFVLYKEMYDCRRCMFLPEFMNEEVCMMTEVTPSVYVLVVLMH